MDQINQTRKELSEVRNLERNRKQEVNEIRTQLQNTLNLRKQDQDDNLELRNALDLASRNRASEGEKQGLIEVENALKDAQQRLVEAQDSERKAIMERNSLEKRSSEAESSRNHLNQESSTSLTKLRNDLRNCETTLEVTTNQLREAEIKHRDLERSFQKEKKLFEERALLFHEFERNLNQTEETLKGEEKRLAEMLGKVDGREEMDDLLSMIKSGGNANKKDKDRLAGQGIEDLLRNVSEHIQDLGEELKRLEGSNERRGRPSYDDDEDDERGSRTIRRDFKVRKTRSQSRGLLLLMIGIEIFHQSPPLLPEKDNLLLIWRRQEKKLRIRPLSESKNSCLKSIKPKKKLKSRRKQVQRLWKIRSRKSKSSNFKRRNLKKMRPQN